MVTFAHQNSEALPKPTPRARAQDRRSIPTASPRLNSPAHANLRRSAYESCTRLGSCSRDPIGYADGANLHQAYFGLGGADPSGEWTWLGGDLWKAGSDDDSFEYLVRELLISYYQKWVDVDNISCIIPKPTNANFQQMKAKWKGKKPLKCGVYSVANIIDALPNGGEVRGAVGNDRNNYIATAANFYGAGRYNQSTWTPYLAQRAGNGKTPVESVIVIGHGTSGANKIGGDGSNVLFGKNFVSFPPRPVAFAWPTFDNAVAVNLPPGCWLRTDARVRLVGCNTRTMAQRGKQMFGRAASQRFFGTKTYTFAPANGMGWGKIANNNIVHDTSKPTASDPETYHFGSGHIDNWIEF